MSLTVAPYRRSVVRKHATALSGYGDSNYISHGSAMPTIASMTTGAMAMWVYQTSNTTRSCILSKDHAGVQNEGMHTFEIREDGAVNNCGLVIARSTGTPLTVSCLLTNLPFYTIGKWIFLYVQWDIAIAANCQLWSGDEFNAPVQVTTYQAQTAGTGAVQDDASAPLIVGRSINQAGRQMDGPIASYDLTPRRLAGDGGVRLLWEYGPSALNVPWYIAAAYGQTASGLQRSVGSPHHGLVTGTLTPAHGPIRPTLHRRPTGKAPAAAPSAFPHHYYAQMQAA